MFSSRACCEDNDNVHTNVSNLKNITINEISNRSYHLGTCPHANFLLCTTLEINHYFLPISGDEKTKAQSS